MNYLKLLENGYKNVCEFDGEISKLEYLSNYIFDFVTYDSNLDELFALRALNVCLAIENGTMFEYQKSEENYEWYIIMCNMPFFIDKLEWGTSIRGAWWDFYNGNNFIINGCGLWDGERQLGEDLVLNKSEWSLFIKAMDNFINKED